MSAFFVLSDAYTVAHVEEIDCGHICPPNELESELETDQRRR
jgi:hypothetical protein